MRLKVYCQGEGNSVHTDELNLCSFPHYEAAARYLRHMYQTAGITVLDVVKVSEIETSVAVDKQSRLIKVNTRGEAIHHAVNDRGDLVEVVYAGY